MSGLPVLRRLSARSSERAGSAQPPPRSRAHRREHLPTLHPRGSVAATERRPLLVSLARPEGPLQGVRVAALDRELRVGFEETQRRSRGARPRSSHGYHRDGAVPLAGEHAGQKLRRLRVTHRRPKTATQPRGRRAPAAVDPGARPLASTDGELCDSARRTVVELSEIADDVCEGPPRSDRRQLAMITAKNEALDAGQRIEQAPPASLPSASTPRRRSPWRIRRLSATEGRMGTRTPDPSDPQSAGAGPECVPCAPTLSPS